jgi:hypothetical protein
MADNVQLLGKLNESTCQMAVEDNQVLFNTQDDNDEPSSSLGLFPSIDVPGALDAPPPQAIPPPGARHPVVAGSIIGLTSPETMAPRGPLPLSDEPRKRRCKRRVREGRTGLHCKGRGGECRCDFK